ncbi:transposase family protein [Streptomyces sp. NBC_00056]|uniref:transposase family protein n=1 Tax=unclassified Streptomyces TaxID=2593676 RepID=UPI0038644077
MGTRRRCLPTSCRALHARPTSDATLKTDCGKHKHHGMNVQVLTDPFGRLFWASPAMPGSSHDLTAARQYGDVDALAGAHAQCWAEWAYAGVGRGVRVPLRGRRLKRRLRKHKNSHAKFGVASTNSPWPFLKGRCRLRKPRCGTNRIADIVKAATMPQPHWERLSDGEVNRTAAALGPAVSLADRQELGEESTH